MACGVLGPATFTAAWLIAAGRQDGYSPAVEHVSGLAARDATDPQVMSVGFFSLGASLWPFATAVEEALGGPSRAGPAPTLVRLAGTAIGAAGVLRRDRMLLEPPDDSGFRSWQNHGHDLASAVAYVSATTAPAVLAARVRADPAWHQVYRPALGVSALTGGLLALFGCRAVDSCNGYVQRAAVTLPAAATAAMAVTLWRHAPSATPTSTTPPPPRSRLRGVPTWPSTGPDSRAVPAATLGTRRPTWPRSRPPR